MSQINYNKSLLDIQDFLMNEYRTRIITIDIRRDVASACDSRGNMVADFPYDDEVELTMAHSGFIKLISDLMEFKESKLNATAVDTEEIKCTFDEVMQFNVHISERG